MALTAPEAQTSTVEATNVFGNLFNWKARREEKQKRQAAEKLALETLLEFEKGTVLSNYCPSCHGKISLEKGESFFSASCPCDLCNITMVEVNN